MKNPLLKEKYALLVDMEEEGLIELRFQFGVFSYETQLVRITHEEKDYEWEKHVLQDSEIKLLDELEEELLACPPFIQDWEDFDEEGGDVA